MNEWDTGKPRDVSPGGHASGRRPSYRISDAIEPLVCTFEDDAETRHRKVQFAIASSLIVPAGLIWAGLYFSFGERAVAILPLAYSVLTLLNLALLLRLQRHELFRRGQQFLILVLPVAMHLGLGGIVGSSMVLLWSFIAVLEAVLFAERREAYWWFAAYVILMVAATAAQPQLTIENRLPELLVLILFVLNVVAVSSIAFTVLFGFVTARRRLRELEAAYLKQDMALRQSEKLATLGTLAAGIAHELNNPAAATRRAAEQLREAFWRLDQAQVRLGAVRVPAAGLEALKILERQGRERAARVDDREAVARSDLEAAVEEWMDEREVADAWELAPPLVDQGLDPDALDSIASAVGTDALAPALAWLAGAFPVHVLLHEISEGSARISEIVGALKNYSFLDQAPSQAVDLHEGLDNTLVILRSKLKSGITVRREYSTDMPAVPAYGSELNQVWTNLLDNAADSLGGAGTIAIRTEKRDGFAVVEIEDDGPGIPTAIQPKIFDPFFTTKPPGKGTGLGLSTTHRIVVEKHGGTIWVKSRPGLTRFTVRLPYDGPSTGTSSGGEQTWPNLSS